MKSKEQNRQVTILDIAESLGITPSTVSRALHNHTNISEETRQAVHDCAKKMKYRRNVTASSLRTGKSQTIGVIVPRINSHFISSVIGGIETVAEQAGYNIIICQSNESLEAEKNVVRTLLSKGIDGMMASISIETTNSSHFSEVINLKMPLVFFDRACPDLDVSSVTIDDYKGAYKATEHLVKQGCLQIAYFGGNTDLDIYRRRIDGYKQALINNHIPVDEKMIFTTNQMTDTIGSMLIENLYKDKNLPDGICAANDNLAAGAMKYLMEHNIKIPQQVAIIGFSNALFTQWMTPQLSTVDQHSELMGNHAVTLLLEEIEQTNDDCVSRNIVLNPELMIRGSSLRINEE
jgi:LacI family transcriptional regulator